MARADVTHLCRRCTTAPVESVHSTGPRVHPNAAYCAACRVELRRQPASQVTDDQAAALWALLGTRPQAEVCAALGLSDATVDRWRREVGYPRGHWDAYAPETIQAVCAAYSALGKVRTQALFPAVNVRAIVDRHRDLMPPRQVRWTGPQLIEAIRMAGLVSPNAQARFFGRPNAYHGSIKSLWTKHLRCHPRDLHGLPASLSYGLAQPGTPAVLLAPDQEAPQGRMKVLWLDLRENLREEVEDEVFTCVQALAAWQRWVWGCDAWQIRQVIQQREGGSMTVGDRPRDVQAQTNGHAVVPKSETAPVVAEKEGEGEIFSARSIVSTLERLMNAVTEDQVTPETVQAACLCSAQIASLLRVHLEVLKLNKLSNRR